MDVKFPYDINILLHTRLMQQKEEMVWYSVYLMKMTGYYINCVDTDQCKTEKIVQGCIYLQSFQEEDFLWNVLGNLSCLKLNVFSLTKSTFYTFNSLSCWWIYCDPTDDHIFQCFSYGNKDQGHVCGKGSLAVCMCNCIKIKLAQMFG